MEASLGSDCYDLVTAWPDRAEQYHLNDLPLPHALEKSNVHAARQINDALLDLLVRPPDSYLQARIRPALIYADEKPGPSPVEKFAR